MQIHELTSRRVNEGLLDKAKSVASKAGSTIAKQFNNPTLGTKLGNTPSSPTPGGGSGANVEKQTEVLVKQLSKEWQTMAPKILASLAKPAPTPPPQQSQQPISIGGQKLDPNNPKDAQVIASLQKQGKLEEAGDAPTPASEIHPVNRTTTAVDNGYGPAFENWVNKKLTSRVPGSSVVLGMKQVKENPEAAQQLAQALQAVIKSKDNPASNAAAVENYLRIAIKSMQATSAALKQEHPEEFTNTVRSNVIVKTTGNREADAVLQQQGFEVIP